jgi:hypothetical protein
MRLVRSWPARIPPGRSHVVDDMDRLVIDNCDYTPLAELDEDCLLIEWDIAVDREGLRSFAERARAAPDRVLVAPYLLYADAYHLPADIWAHRRWDGTGSGTTSPTGARPVATGDPVCNLFGFGMAHLPRDLVRRFVESRWSAHFGDVEFSMWHHARVTREVPICWEARPVHLNYRSVDLCA